MNSISLYESMHACLCMYFEDLCVKSTCGCVELDRVCELLHMVVGECEVRGKVGNCVLVCVQSHIWYVCDLQVCVGVSILLAYEK